MLFCYFVSSNSILYMISYANSFYNALLVISSLWFLLIFSPLWQFGPIPRPGLLLRSFPNTLIGHTTVGKTPLDEWSARRRDLYLHNTQRSQQTYIHATGGIRTHNLSRRAAADLRHVLKYIVLKYFYNCLPVRLLFTSSCCPVTSSKRMLVPG